MSSTPFHPLDEQLASLLVRLDGGSVDARQLYALAGHVSARTREGVIAVPLADAPVPDVAALLASPALGREGETTPLVTDGTHVWLYRYWQYEERLARSIHLRCTAVTPPALPVAGDGQAYAVELALASPFLIIAGGPGTGKTTTATRILWQLLEQGIAPHRILLAAPTGKAAMRMQESIRHIWQKEGVPYPMPEQASTLHRLLGWLPNRSSYRHHADNPLAADVVIVDEASMIDIALLTHLFEAVAPETKLILLGDADQLAAVEIGSVFRDLCHSPALQAHTVLLQASHRFRAEDGIGQLAQAIRTADTARLLAVLADAAYPTVTWEDGATALTASRVLAGWAGYVQAVQAGEVAACLRALNAFRLLTPLRQGPLGVANLNAWVDGIMQRQLPRHPQAAPPWYVGRPVLVTQNDYRLNLFNGDIGIALPHGQDGLRVFFPDGAGGQYRAIAPARLPAHETAWAMTVHKSQGSEFEDVLLVLPEDADLPLLGRELVYTAVTRAKRGVHVLASATVLTQALQRTSPPVSRLPQRLQSLRDAGRLQ